MDINIIDIDFASGQEPLAGEDYVSLVRVEFTVGGDALARLLGRQHRVLDRALKQATERQLINAAMNSDELLKTLTPTVSKFVRQYLAYELDEPHVAKAVVDFAQEDSCFSLGKAFLGITDYRLVTDGK
jgi:hypothetical protein